jgi:putative ABC transport system permease protein
VPQSLGHPWSTARLGGQALVTGAAPQAADDVVIGRDLGASVGEPITLLTAAGPQRYTVSGITNGSAVYLADERAKELSGGVRVIGVLTTPGADLTAVASAATAIVAGDGQVLTGDDRGAAEPRSDARTRWIGLQVLAAMGAIALFVAVFVVASTFAFGVLQRRRELGLLRTVGASPAQLRRLVFGEALILGAVAAAGGVLCGALAAPLLGRLLIDAGFEPSTFQVRFTPLPMLTAYAAGLLVALAGVTVAARRATRIRPLEALREADVQRRPMTRPRWLLGGAGLLFGALLSVAAAASSGADMANFALLGAMALIVGLSLLAPAVLAPLIRLLTAALAGRRGALTMLVRGNSLAAIHRTAATAAPVLLTVAFAVLVTGMVQTTAGAFAARRADAAPAPFVLVPAGAPGLSDAAVSAAPGLSLISTTVYLGKVPLSAVGVPPGPLPMTPIHGSLSALDGSAADSGGSNPTTSTPATTSGETAIAGAPAAGQPQGLPDGSAQIAITAAVAAARGWAVGDSARLTVESGQSLAVRVVAVLPDGSVPAELVLRRSVVRQADPSALTEVVYLTGAAASPGPLPGSVAARVVDSATHAAGADAEEDRLVWSFTLILVLMAVGFSTLAVANTLVMATIGRRADFAVLRRTGATARQVLGMVAAETALVVTLGSMLGAAVAVPALLAVRAGLQDQVGAPVPLVIAWPTLGVVLAACLLFGLAASVLPARTLLRTRWARQSAPRSPD